jgi:AcrR family transcriptional regulator
MASSRGDSAVTKREILAAARELFAAHGVDGVSVRQIAAAAGVNHALVHRYFGTKSDMVAEILLAEGEAMSAMGKPDAEAGESLAAFRDIMEYILTDGQTSLLLMLRAEIDGLEPESLLGGAPLRPLGLLGAWLAERGAGGVTDPQALAVLLGAAIMGFSAVQPMLSAGVGLETEDPAEVRRRFIDAVVAVAAAAIGRGPQPDAAGGPGPAA